MSLARLAEIPAALDAERVVVATLLETRHALYHFVDPVRAEDFWSPVHRRLFIACGVLEDIGPWPWQGVVSSANVRTAAAAVLADVPIDVVRRIAKKTPVMFDASNWARAVADAARRWRLMGATSDAFNQLVDGADVGEILLLLSDWQTWRPAA
jgi:replicative DNA helicase